MTKLYYNYSSEGYYISSREARENPLEPKIKGKKVYLLPAFATFEEPPAEEEGKKIRWNQSEWINEDIPIEPVEPEPTAEELLETAIEQAVSNREIYISKTDKYALREIDEPNTYPQEIKDKRILARTEINQIEQETDIDKIVIGFS